MNRAERRQQTRRNKEYDNKQYFTKKELEVMNEECYNLGVKHAVQAMREEFGIGLKRLVKFNERLRWIQYQDFTLYLQDVKGQKK